MPTRNDLTDSRLVVPALSPGRMPGGVPQPDGGETPVGAGEVYILDAGVNGSAGSYGATPLSPSGEWQVGTQSGDFSWSFPSNEVEQGEIVPATKEEFTDQFIGTWLLCQSPSIFSTSDDIGLEIEPNGRWSKLIRDPSGSLVRLRCRRP